MQSDHESTEYYDGSPRVFRAQRSQIRAVRSLLRRRGLAEVLLLEDRGQEGRGLRAPQGLGLNARLLQGHAVESYIQLLLRLRFKYLRKIAFN